MGKNTNNNSTLTDMRNVIILLLLLIFTSCDIQKKASKTKNDIDYSEWVKTQTVRKGDTVTFVVPNVVYKDTVITTVSTQGTILKTYYNSDGKISKSDCISSEIALMEERLINLIDKSKEKEVDKSEAVGMDLIPWIVGGIVVMFLIFMTFFFVYMKSQSNKFNVLNDLIKNKL